MIALGFLAYVPVGASIVLGALYLVFSDGSRVTKTVGTVAFFVAVYLQFFSRWALAGLLLQIVLALLLEFRRRLHLPSQPGT
jgi:hypothetical protein